MSLEEQIDIYYKLCREIEALEEKKQALRGLLVEQLAAPTTKFSQYTVRRYSRFSFRTKLEEAKLFLATKMEEVIDKEKLKALYLEGAKIKGISEVQYLQVMKGQLEAQSRPLTENRPPLSRESFKPKLTEEALLPKEEKHEDLDWIL